MSARITVDVASAIPPYDQIRSQISSLIAVGSLEEGSRLPTVRSLASDLGVAPGTVARAYKELESAGLIESRRRNGTVVTGGARGTHNPADTDTPEVSAAVVHLIQSARRAGLDDDTLMNLVRARLET
ncbi:GntR family transcriptional regulator [Arthrobacter sp. H5]|uniref:GntR family transcriptional regulator n=1 Tax=Arthrobacter sp. H5 TaxID=1267973 RepID=UPI0004849F05|nr:GntR family transcriptional regulator [Arthrobacter sp. H5]